MDNTKKIEELSKQLDSIIRRQESFNGEIKALKFQIEQLKSYRKFEQAENEAEISLSKTDISSPSVSEKKAEIPQKVVLDDYSRPDYEQTEPKTERKSNIEKFIGENLISKIGIVILVIGVGIGAKFAIEHSLVSPIVRIIGGYIMGLALLGLAIKLKSKYHNYSAVLLSGSMAILYFITFAAFSFYQLIPQPLTFALLLVFTVFTVFASISYNQQVIAHIGLVGAYAVPFLISTDSGNTMFLFIYTAVINAGILIIAIKRYWKPLYLSAFLVTWIIYLVWYIGDYSNPDDFTLGISFLSIFFTIFFCTFLTYKLINKGKFAALDVILLTSNSFVFYGLGCAIIANRFDDNQYIGLFTLITAVVHFVVTYFVYSMKLADKNLFYLLAGLVLIFLTIVFPVQFDGNWVTIFWAGEALVLLWIGRMSSVKIYEYLSYPIILLAFFSLVHDWSMFYDNIYSTGSTTTIHVFFNMCFLTSVFVILSLIANYYLIVKSFNNISADLKDILRKIMLIAVPVMLIVTAYFSFELEIEQLWNQKISASEIKLSYDGDQSYPYTQTDTSLELFKSIWILNYTMFFAALTSLFLIGFKSGKTFIWINLGIGLLILIIFLSKGLYDLSELRNYYLDNELGEYYSRGAYYIIIRYISYVFVALLGITLYRMHDSLGFKTPAVFDLMVAGTILWILTSELLNWLDIADSVNIYKLALSIFWGIYALTLVIIGIWKKKTHLRIAAFAILGATLLKLFFYDLSNMKPVSRAILFIALGILMLGVSFLYNKYKNVIFDEKKV